MISRTLIERMRRELGMVIDHDKYDRKTGTLISRPYPLSMDDIRRLIAFCDANGLGFVVRPDLTYYPEHTIELQIKRVVR